MHEFAIESTPEHWRSGIALISRARINRQWGEGSTSAFVQIQIADLPITALTIGISSGRMTDVIGTFPAPWQPNAWKDKGMEKWQESEIMQPD